MNSGSSPSVLRKLLAHRNQALGSRSGKASLDLARRDPGELLDCTRVTVKEQTFRGEHLQPSPRGSPASANWAGPEPVSPVPDGCRIGSVYRSSFAAFRILLFSIKALFDLESLFFPSFLTNPYLTMMPCKM